MAAAISTLWPVVTNMWVVTNFMSPKHERQHQQSRRPCDHHSQQKPLIGFHYRVPTLISPMILTARRQQFRYGLLFYPQLQRLRLMIAASTPCVRI